MTDRLVAAVRGGRLDRARLNQVARRVLPLKGYTRGEVASLLR